MNIVKVEHLLKYDLCITLAKLPRAASHMGTVLPKARPTSYNCGFARKGIGIKRCSAISERDVKLLVQERRR